MSQTGIYLTLWIGRASPKSAKRELAEALQSVEVTHSDEGRSGFQVTFQTSNNGIKGSEDLKPFSRVILMVTINAVQQVLMDGIIAHQQLTPGDPGTGTSTLTVTGEDVSIMMDLKEKAMPHPGQDEATIARSIISSYSQYGLTDGVVNPQTINRPSVNEWTPRQRGTDLELLKNLADRYAFDFYVIPGPKPKKNTAYWGPPKSEGTPQGVLNVNMGPNSNVETINFRYNALAPVRIEGQVQDRETNQIESVQATSSQRSALSREPALTSQSHVRTRQFRQSGLNAREALARAQAMTDNSVDEVATAEGELNALRYGNLLKPREPVNLRGAGHGYDGTWYVKRVTHSIQRGDYKQRFVLTREGLGPKTSRV
ncbi:MAG TPA: hypothetical protein PLM24_00100 [Methanothrix sp.]|nr:hypothetical protein [Methanothrix sp.]HPJ83488.1 hypothetical protein [Methanothrix sp.]HPR65517.1 hypothetical protein [Methanothrix sp.]